MLTYIHSIGIADSWCVGSYIMGTYDGYLLFIVPSTICYNNVLVHQKWRAKMRAMPSKKAKEGAKMREMPSKMEKGGRFCILMDMTINHISNKLTNTNENNKQQSTT